MTHRHILFFSIIILSSLTLQAQDIFQKGTIHFNNGDSIETYIKVYDYNILQSQRKFEHKQQGKIIKVKGDDISTITLSTLVYEKLWVAKKGHNSNPMSNRPTPPDTTYFFATRTNTTEPKLYTHYGCGPLFSYNNGCNDGNVNFTTFLTPYKNKYKTLSDFYYSDQEDLEMKNTPYLYNEKLGTYIYFKPHPKTPTPNSIRPGIR